jgi:hypothetical protein
MESSEDKTKRKFAKHLLYPIWDYQYAVFYETPEDSIDLLKDQAAFRQALKRKYPNQPFLVRVQTLRSPRRRNVLQAYLVMYTTQKAPGIKELANHYFPVTMNVIYRKMAERNRAIKAHKILNQRPHDLEKLLGKVRIRRYGVINKHLLEALESAQDADEN